jgi:hypothetical protein
MAIDHRRFAGTAGAGDAEDRRRGGAVGSVDVVPLLDSSDRPRHRKPMVGVGTELAGLADRGRVEVGGLDHEVDHAVEAHLPSVFGGEDLGHAVRLERLDLARHDHPTTAAEDQDVGGIPLAQQVDHVAEELVVATLVGGDGDRLGILLDGGIDDLGDRAVVAEVDDLGAVGLKDPAHDVDRRVVAVEQRGGGHEADDVLRGVGLGHRASRRWFRPG